VDMRCSYRSVCGELKAINGVPYCGDKDAIQAYECRNGVIPVKEDRWQEMVDSDPSNKPGWPCPVNKALSLLLTIGLVLVMSTVGECGIRPMNTKQIVQMRIAKLIPHLIEQEQDAEYKEYSIGDKGRAYGCLQIHPICVRDVNERYNTKYVHIDLLDGDIQMSKDICMLFLTHYGVHYSKKFNKTASMEVLARMWNGGPRGYQKSSTLKYWKEVQSLINNK
jgi:hypothetical protein